MTQSSAVPVFQSPHDIALKLFREAGRTWNAPNLIEMGDHLYNFCVTNSSLRDWVVTSKGLPHSFMQSWRTWADGMNGHCADIANASKHLLIKPVSISVQNQKLVALGPNGVIEGQERERQAFQLEFTGGGDSVDLLMFIHKICMAWEKYFEQETDLPSLPSHGEFMMTIYR